MPKTVIIEDEPLSRMYLCNLLGESFPDITVAGFGSTAAEAIALLQAEDPDIIFLDIELQVGTGFGVISSLPAIRGHIIFTTALDQQATRILRIAGVPYIQKPIDSDSLCAAVRAAQNPVCATHHIRALGHLLDTLNNHYQPKAMFVSGPAGHAYVPLQDIVSIDGHSAGCRLHLAAGETVESCYTLRELEELLQPLGFFRTHMQHMVNLGQIALPLRPGSELLAMLDGSAVPLSPKKAGEVLRLVS